MVRKTLSILLCMALLLCMSVPVFATTHNEDPVVRSVEDILNDYHIRINNLENTANYNTYSQDQPNYDSITQDTLKELTDAGYYAYAINPDTYYEIEDDLNASLEELEIEPYYSYIIVISGEDTGASGDLGTWALPKFELIGPPDFGNSSFEYTYNGITHTMAYITVTSVDDPDYYKVGNVSLLDDTNVTADLIIEVLNCAISWAVDEVAECPVSLTWGIIGSIIGAAPDNINPQYDSYLIFSAVAKWTRTYTVIYDEGLDMWLKGSSVDYVTTTTRLQGEYFDDAIQDFVVTSESNTKSAYSEHYSDYTWRKQQAAIGWTYNWPRHEYVGDVRLYATDEEFTLDNFPPPVMVLTQTKKG